MNKLNFGDNEVGKKEFYDSKKAIKLNLVVVGKIVVSNKIKGNNETSKYFIDYMADVDVVTSLCIILPQMSGYIKYFENGRKNMPFKIEDESVYIKYNHIWNKIKELFGVKLYSEPIYDDNYIKTKVKTFSDIIKTLFSRGDKNPDKIPKERIEYACIACISVNSYKFF